MHYQSSFSPRHRLFLAALAAVQAVTVAPRLFATASTWAGGAIWNDPVDWSPNGIPNSNTADVIFANTSVGTVNISSSVITNSLTFTNTNGTYTITSSAGQTLSNLTSINLGPNLQAIDFISLANVTTGSLLFTGTLAINNNVATGAGGLIIGTTTVIGSPGSGGLSVQGPGLTILQNSFATGSTDVVGGINKSGPGILDDESNGTNLLGNITLNGGTFVFDFQLSTAIKVQSTSTLQLDGGILQFSPNSNTVTSQAFAATSIISGHTEIAGTASASGTSSLSLAAISRTAGATLDVTPSSGSQVFTISTTSGNTNNLLGTGPAYATVNNGAGWATVSGVNIAPLAGYSVNIFGTGLNTDLTASNSIGNLLTNSLRFNTGNLTLNLAGNATLQSGGVLVTPNAGNSLITGGNLSAPSSGELLFHVYNNNTLAGLTVNSNLTSTVGLTKAGPGTLVLGGTNTGLAGPVNVNTGSLTLTTPAAANSTSAINFNDDRTQSQLQTFTVDLGNNVNGTIAPPIRLASFALLDFQSLPAYGTYFSTGNSTNTVVTLSGVLSSASGLTTPIRFTNNTFGNDTSQFNLTNAANSFTGNISLHQGALGITADAVFGNAANTLILDVNDSAAGGLVFLNSGITINHPISTLTPTRIVSNGADSNTIASTISGAGGIVKDGTGTLNYSTFNTYTGDTTVNAGTLSLGIAGTLGSNVNLNIATSGTFIASPNSAVFLHLNALTLNGGTFRVTTGSGNTTVNQIGVIGPGGTIDLTGTSAYNIKFVNPAPAITVLTNGTWISPTNNSILNNIDSVPVSINIVPGATLTNGIALAQSFFGYVLTGGGTLYQNSDATNELNINANIQVTQGTFRVTDISSNSGVGNLGTGRFTLDGGTLSYGGSTASTTKTINLTTSGGAINVESAATTLTLSNPITGVAPLTKSGPGTLALTNASNNFSSLTINGGTVSTLSDSTLGTGPITLANAASILFSGPTSSSRTFNLNAGSLLSTGGTLTLNAATINGGFLRGSGTFTLTGGTTLTGVTTFSNALLNQSGAASFTAFNNGGTLNNTSPLSLTDGTNNFTGIINISSAVTTQNFGSTGIINISPGGSLTNSGSNLFLGGGSRTYIGNISNHGGTITLSGGTTLEVNGALLVNDGTITGTTDVNFGGVAQGVGSYGPVNVSFGGTFQPGFASSGIINNGALVTALNGTGTIDNTSTGNMTLTLTGSSTSTFSGPIQNTAGTTALAVQGTSSLILLTTPLANGSQSVNTFTGGLSIANGASVTIAALNALPNASTISNNGSLSINANSTASILSGSGSLILGPNAFLTLATSSGGSKQGSLSLTPTSTLNLSNNQFVLEAPDAATKSTDLSQVASLVASGKSTGFGITSSALGANLGLAVIDNATLLTPFTHFGGQPVDANSILIAPELLGDANIDGHVDLNDLNTVLNNLGRTTGAWNNGNFDGASTIDLNDLNAVLNRLGLTYANSSNTIAESLTPAATPEPASLALLALTLPLFLKRRPAHSRPSPPSK